MRICFYDLFVVALATLISHPEPGYVMSLNGQNEMIRTSDVNPSYIVTVTDFSPNTLRSIIAHLEVSREFEHFVYREAELDAIWCITGFFLGKEHDSSQREAVQRLHAGAHKAHDMVADRRPEDAATILRTFL
jgi:hypothetical protein